MSIDRAASSNSPTNPSATSEGSTRTESRIQLFLVSFLLLFFELAVIRWIPANVRIIGYYSNLVLVSCFLGFGLGCILKTKRNLFGYFPLATLGLIALSFHLSSSGVANPGDGDVYLYGGGGRYGWLLAVPLVFVVNALPFVCIGQRLAQYLDHFRPIPGYSINIAGSLLGTLSFAAVSFLQLTPPWWFGIAFGVALFGLVRPRWLLALGGLAFVVATWMVHIQSSGFLWSPYYKVGVQPLRPFEAQGQRIVVNHDYHQLVLDLSGRWNPFLSGHRDWQLTYDFPYLMRGEKSSERVLILGAGAGNDAAAALRNGAQAIDAVELDPTIYRLGLEMHPERPYEDPRVSVILNDARFFVRDAKRSYDLVVLGWLDSHRLFSSFSNVRQDNFVYTVEALRATAELLAEDGEIYLSFCAEKGWVGAKLYAMIHEATGQEPSVYAMLDGAYGRPGIIFRVGNRPVDDRPPVAGFTDLTEEYRELAQSAAPPTDDWPYLYYRERSISKEYLLMGVILVVSAALMVGPAIGSARLRPKQGLHFLLLGAGFLLLEVRNITLLALIFGSTWLTTSVVISAVLVMILIGNWVVESGWAHGRRRLSWVLLCVSIVLSLVWREDLLPIDNAAVTALLTTLVISSTFLFAAIVFAGSFARVSTPSAALGFNVLGSVLGGMSEYASLLVGVSGLSVIALGLYLSGWLTDRFDAT